MLASEGYRSLLSDMYVVETQRTRGGKDSTSGEDTPERTATCSTAPRRTPGSRTPGSHAGAGLSF